MLKGCFNYTFICQLQTLMLRLYKCQIWKEHVKLSNAQYVHNDVIDCQNYQPCKPVNRYDIYFVLLDDIGFEIEEPENMEIQHSSTMRTGMFELNQNL